MKTLRSSNLKKKRKIRIKEKKCCPIKETKMGGSNDGEGNNQG